MALLNTWARDREATREREGDDFRDPLRCLDPMLPPDVLDAFKTANSRGYLLPAESARAAVGRLWSQHCVEQGLPDVRIVRPSGAQTCTIAVRLGHLDEPPAAEVVARIAQQLRQATVRRGRLVASDSTIIGGSIPPERAPGVALEVLAMLRSTIQPEFGADNSVAP